MIVPTSTYRLQFRSGITFDKAIRLIPHLKDLGISHLYASPIFSAAEGSAHGYDVIDPNEIDPAIGGREGFERLAGALRRAGLGLIIDIVPNHMAASIENAWWRDVLRHGGHSPYARHFDIDWSEKLTLPQLGNPLDEVLTAGELELFYDQTEHLVMLAYFDNRFPLSDDSSRHVLAQTDGDDEKLRAFSQNAPGMKQLLAEQHWRLLYWNDAASHLNYRRFFEVSGLAGIRIEDPEVFDNVHRLSIELVRSGKVQGLRIDHIDGLADPKAYLTRLRQAVGADTFIVVEKILGSNETLPSDWPVSGTTGYEFISAMAQLFIAGDGLSKIDTAYAATAGKQADFQESLREAKLLMIRRNFAGEVRRLIQLAQAIYPELDPDDISSALEELLIAFPVYRIYGDRGPLEARDEEILAAAVAHAQPHARSMTALAMIGRILGGDVDGAHAVEFQTQFQQLSGPIMAKAVEDTLFYRYNRLIAANEVGGDPSQSPGGVSMFHRMMVDRTRHQRHGLSATSTHDTKRGEDARARLYAVSECPDVWIEGVGRWRDLNKAFRRNLSNGPAPEPNVEWMLYQALAGIWPDDFRCNGNEELQTRFVAYVEKAIREAKLRTDWMARNADYEEAVLGYAAALLSPDNHAFATDFDKAMRLFAELGYLNSLSQTLIKLTAPGIPDIYQGCEGLDFNLVDPDNRRIVEYSSFSEPGASDTSSKARQAASRKRHIIRTVLQYRNERPQLFLDGLYQPLDVIGRRQDNLVAFARHYEDQTAITIAPRLLGDYAASGMDNGGPDFWQDTTVLAPPWLRGPKRDLLTGKPVDAGDIAAASILADYPVSVLVPVS
ncbi:malto-oligosyltrehalose synthase [Rhizobium sp. RCC_161_2]|uniref:malto-oligosyltrehalose synthase n=1 Tax=Rhizobium sp. RCC_161_2 TaxID=3239219 RepID=UPI003525E99E